MTILIYVLALPVASGFVAALLGLRDGGHTSWQLVRVLTIALVLLSLMLWLGPGGTHAIGAALATIVVMQIIGFYAWRIFAIGIRNRDSQ